MADNIIALIAPESENGYYLECSPDGLRVFYTFKLPFYPHLISAFKWVKQLTGNYEILGLASELEEAEVPEHITDPVLIIKEII